ARAGLLERRGRGVGPGKGEDAGVELMSPFALSVGTPERIILRTAAEALVLKSAVGGLTILDGHASLIAQVVPCNARVENEGAEAVHLAVHGGFLELDTSPGTAETPELEDLGVTGGPVPGLSTRVTLLA